MAKKEKWIGYVNGMKFGGMEKIDHPHAKMYQEICESSRTLGLFTYTFWSDQIPIEEIEKMKSMEKREGLKYLFEKYRDVILLEDWALKDNMWEDIVTGRFFIGFE